MIFYTNKKGIVRPLSCHKCHALWLFWPKERTGQNHDSLNLQSTHSCGYCESADETMLVDINKGFFALPVENTASDLHRFLDAASGEGVIFGGVAADDLYAEIFPKTYAKMLLDSDHKLE